MVRIRTVLILFIAVSGILATIAFIGYNQLQPAPPEGEVRLEAALSSSSVKIGETLEMRVNLTGPKVWSVGLARFTVVNSNGEKVYDVDIWLPHRTLAGGEDPPQEYVFNLEWEAEKSPTTGNVEVTPGSYSFIVALEVEGKELNVRGTIEVTPLARALGGDEIQRLIMEDPPDVPNLEFKPETIWFLSMSLDPSRKVWVVEYHVEGRISGEESPFVAMYFRALINRYTGERISLEKIDLQAPENILTKEEVRTIITNWSYINLEVKPETIEFQSLKLVCLRTTTQTWAWVVEYEIEGRGTGIAVHAATGEIIEPQFHRMSFQVIINAYTDEVIWMDDYRWKWSSYRNGTDC